MGFWSKLFGRKGAEADAGRGAPAQDGRASAAADADRSAGAHDRKDAPGRPAGARSGADAGDLATERLERLERLGKPAGATVSEAVALLRHTEGTPAQTAVVQVLLRVLQDEPEHEPLRVACAGVLVNRGQSDAALEVVSSSRSVAGMMLAADLHAGRGDIARAVSTVERVLARAIDTPGARERHERWCDQLGRRAMRDRGPVDDGATVIAPAGPKTPFRLLREVARGGAGTVYEAEDELLGRRLAYKVYHRAERDREQIEREAAAAIELSGPGVLRIYDADPSAGWLATEWIPRGSLRDMLRTGQLAELLPLSRWVPALVRALGRIHQQHLVHADIKPGNVLFRQPDDPILGDFGICRRRGEESLAGTPGYLAPERLAGGPADPRDDVYAIGRIVEDVLGAIEEAHAQGHIDFEPDAEELDRYELLARACLSDAALRPADGSALLRLLVAANSAQ